MPAFLLASRAPAACRAHDAKDATPPDLAHKQKHGEVGCGGAHSRSSDLRGLYRAFVGVMMGLLCGGNTAARVQVNSVACAGCCSSTSDTGFCKHYAGYLRACHMACLC